MNYTVTQIGKASSTLSKTAEVDSSTFSTALSNYGKVAVKFAYTKGDESNATIRFYVSQDASTWVAVEDDGGKTYETLTSTGTKVYRFGFLPFVFFKVTVRTTDGTPTGTYTTDYFYHKAGSQR